jgi:hypothetical protein
MSGPSARRFLAAILAPISIVGALAFTACAALLFRGVPPGIVRAADLTAVLLASVLVALLAHDGAHLVAAAALRFRIVTAALGPFIFTPTRRGLHVRAVRSWRDLRGILLAAPRDDRRMNARAAMIAAAGPVASLALGLATLEVAPVVAFASLLRFALAALPLGRRGDSTDGAQLLLLAGGGVPADRLCALLRLAAVQRAGTRPRAWPERWIGDAIALHDGSMQEALACVAAFRRSVDGCAHDRAAVFLDRALALRANLPRAAACALLADAAYFEARIHDDADAARAWLEEAAARRPPCSAAGLRAEAAVLLASGDCAGGVRAAREALARLERIERDECRPLPMEADWVREMLARAECAIVISAELLPAG